MEITFSSLTTIAKSSSISIKYFRPPHKTASYLESTLRLVCIHRCWNYRPIANRKEIPSVLISEVLHQNDPRMWVSKLIEHEINKSKTWCDVAHGNSFSKKMYHLDQILSLDLSSLLSKTWNRQSYLQSTISRPWLSWRGETQPSSGFNQCPPKSCTTTHRICCYYGIRRLDRRYFSSISPISK